MELEQQIKSAIEASTAHLSGQFRERLQSLAADLGEWALAEHARALESALASVLQRIAADHEAELAALRTETAEQRELAVSMARTEAAEEREVALAAARADAARFLEDALAAVRAEASARHEADLGAVRAEITSQHEASLEALRAEMTAEQASTLAAVHRELAENQEEALAAIHAEAARERESMAAAIRAECATIHESELAALRAEADERVARARAESDELLALARAEADDRVAAAKAEADDRVAAAKAEADERVTAANAEADERVSALKAEADEQVAAAKAEADVQVARARAEAEELLVHARTEADQRLAAAKAEAEASLAETIAASKAEATEVTGRHLVDARAAERQAELAFAERLSDAIRRLDNARSLIEVIDILVDASAREVPRVAVFLVRGKKLAGWRAAGFTRDDDPRELEVPLDQAGLLTKAVRAPAAVAMSGAMPGDVGAMPFGSLPAASAALAIPLRVGGETVGVLYADDVSPREHEAPSVWPESLDVLSRHACRCLEVVTIARVTQPVSIPAPASPTPAPRRYTPQARTFLAGHDDDDDAARRYARLLVSEIKLYHESAVTAGRRDRNLLERLRSEIERARRLYGERVPAEVMARTDYFDQELVRTLANGDASLLGPA
jgi:chemotaxis protein histidine kinase CheA